MNMIEHITYRTESETSEGTFKLSFGGVEYVGHYEGVVETTTEWSSEYGYMGVTDIDILEETIHIVSEDTGVENLVCRDEHEDIYRWVHDNVLVEENETWEIKETMPKAMMAKYLLSTNKVYFPYGYLNLI
tara:strand:- start:86 stop:478 length:393 start_codon:yes stop_codon:yes gene_type:complete